MRGESMRYQLDPAGAARSIWICAGVECRAEELRACVACCDVGEGEKDEDDKEEDECIVWLCNRSLVVRTGMTRSLTQTTGFTTEKR